jgi:cell pole-organizing protein PopZ
MGAMPNEPSMEEILSSIKRIIADDDRGPLPRAPRRAAARVAQDESDEAFDGGRDTDILLLTEALLAEPAESRSATQSVRAAGARPARAEPEAQPRSEPKAHRGDGKAPRAPAVLSDISARAARESLDHLSKLLVRNDDGQSNTLEGLVRELLRPMLKEWLDAHLPDLVESLVKREIDRITGRV